MKTKARRVGFMWLLAFVMLFSTGYAANTLTANAAKKVKISKTSKTIAVGEKYKLKLKNNRKKVTWKSSNKKVATVSTTGMVKGKKKGTTTITAQVKSTNKSYKCRVKVEKITIDKTQINYLFNSGLQLPNITLSGTNRNVTWIVDNDRVAKPYDSETKKAYEGDEYVTSPYANLRHVCMFHVGNEGSAVITAQVGGYKLKCKISIMSEGRAAGEYIKTGENPYGLSDSVLAAADHIKETIPTVVAGAATREDKIVAVHDYIVNTTKYDYDNYVKKGVPSYDHSILGPVMHGISVCDGYAYTLAAYLTALDIPCELITGNVDSGTMDAQYSLRGNHAWNLVQCSDGQWYHVDVTFDDPVSADTDVTKKTYNYSYLFLTDAEMSKDHKWDVEGYRACNGTLFANYRETLTKQRMEQEYGAANVADSKAAAIDMLAKAFAEKKMEFTIVYKGTDLMTKEDTNLAISKSGVTVTGGKTTTEKKAGYMEFKCFNVAYAQ